MVRNYYNSIAALRLEWRKKARYYHHEILHFYRFVVPEGKKVLEIGTSTGDLLAGLKPKYGVGIDISENLIKIAKKRFPGLKFLAADCQKITIQTKFDYVILSDLIGNLEDVQKVFDELHKVSNEQTRIIISYYNFYWEPLIKLLEKAGLKMPENNQNWLSLDDIQNLLYLAGFEVIKTGNLLLLPVYIPVLSSFMNRYLAKIPLIKNLCLTQYVIARKIPRIDHNREYSVSIVIPARNEAGSIEQAILRTPKIGKFTELIFVEGNSTDNTLSVIKNNIAKYRNTKNIVLVKQGKGKGKGDAVRKGFEKASGEVLMILDADLTVAPEELTKFYYILRSRRGEMIMGSRLVYPMEKDAMRFLNILGNKFFSIMFSFLLGQRIKDTLCGTKVLFKDDYQEIKRNRWYFGNFDPFGDFDLIFGASKLNLKIIEIPIRYRARFYGSTNISRFKHGLLLLKMTLFAARKIKFV